MAEPWSVDDRLLRARQEYRRRHPAHPALAALGPPAQPRDELADGAIVEVDSFLSSLNSGRVADGYPSMSDGVVTERPLVPFRHEPADHPEIAAIRDILADHGLGPGATDLETAIAVRQWVKRGWDHEIPRRSPPYNGRLILDRALRQVDTFICMHYSVAFVHACASLGLPARVVNLHRHVAETSAYVLGEEGSHTPPIDEHVTAEVWCRELGGWVMMDTDFDCHYLREGRPLSAWEIHDALLARALDELEVVRGPGAAAYDSLGPAFYPQVLPTYYRHVSLLMRSDFISDPDGPVPIVHLTDEHTPPILWHDGEDLRLHPHLMGPVVVARRFDRRTSLLTDGGLEGAWASSDKAVEHRVDVTFARPVTLGGIGLSWPEFRGRFQTSRAYRVIGRRTDGSKVELVTVVDQGETPRSRHDFAAHQLLGLRLLQAPGGGSLQFSNRLWLSQVQFFGAAQD